MKDNGSQHKKDAGRLQKRCQRHQTMVASHTAVPIGTANQRSLFASARESKWLDKATPHPKPCR